MSEHENKKIGVFICHCGGNISDYVDVEKVRQVAAEEPGVVLSKTTMFACSDAAQQEIVDAIHEHGLDSIVVASCSPKLHLFTFRSMAERADLNPYRYTQVNLREQCSWSHRDDLEAATVKGAGLVRAGIARARLSESLENFRVTTLPSALIVGAGVAGMRAALALADLGISVHLVERAKEPGGWTAGLGPTFPTGRNGGDLVRSLLEEMDTRDNIALYTGAEIVEKRGSVGQFSVKVRLSNSELLNLDVGAVVVATGFDTYAPAVGELGYGLPGVVTLPDFKRMLDGATGPLTVGGRRVETVAYIYCVGSRQEADEEHPNPHSYCSRYCCTATVHSASLLAERDPSVNQYHLFRDVRTYGKYELLYNQALAHGSLFIKFDKDEPPTVSAQSDALVVEVKDQLMGGEHLKIPADLVVLVTGMVPRPNDELVDVFKLPVGKDGFFNEIHPKLRPVETMVNGVFIAGASQSPKTLAESVASSLAAASKGAALLLRGYVELEPFVATVNAEKCTGCHDCLVACPYEALEKVTDRGRSVVRVSPSLCKGGGACVPACPEGAIDLIGYSNHEIVAAIEALAPEVVHA